MAKEKDKKDLVDDDKIDVKGIADGTDEEVATAAPPASGIKGFFSKVKGQLLKVLGFSIAAILLILISVGISVLVSKKVYNTGINAREGMMYQPKPEPLANFTLDQFTINTADRDEARFLKVTVILGFDAKNLKVAPELASRKMEINDIVLLILKDVTASELETAEGIKELKRLIKEKVNEILNESIEQVYIKDILIT